MLLNYMLQSPKQKLLTEYIYMKLAFYFSFFIFYKKYIISILNEAAGTNKYVHMQAPVTCFFSS